MSWAWIDLVPERPGSATLCAAARDAAGERVGWLAAWRRHARPTRGARRVYDAVLDADGLPASVSLVLPPPGVRLKFDDLAVQHARRVVLAGRPWDVVSTLLSDASHFEGSLVVARGPDASRRLAADPFARIFPARILEVDAGLLGTLPAPAGPTIERYGSAEPWPSDRFE